MGAVNPLWHRWVYASIAKHLHAALDAAGVELVVEFLDKRNSLWLASSSKAEATITGPMTKEISNGLHRIWVDVFVVLTSNLSDNDYEHISNVGTIANTLDQCIIVKDYGETGLLEIGSIKPRPETGETIKVVHLKPAVKDTQIHSTIQTKYLGYFAE